MFFLGQHPLTVLVPFCQHPPEKGTECRMEFAAGQSFPGNRAVPSEHHHSRPGSFPLSSVSQDRSPQRCPPLRTSGIGPLSTVFLSGQRSSPSRVCSGRRPVRLEPCWKSSVPPRLHLWKGHFPRSRFPIRFSEVRPPQDSIPGPAASASGSRVCQGPPPSERQAVREGVPRRATRPQDRVPISFLYFRGRGLAVWCSL